MDMSLDDIIKKNNKSRGPQNQRARLQNNGGGRRKNTPGRSNKPLQNSNGRINKPARRPSQTVDKSRAPFANKSSGMVDARMKIIQKNRMRMTDARDRLSNIAKQTDARTKIRGRNLKNVSKQQDGRRDRGQVGGRVPRGNFNRGITTKAPVLQRSIRNNVANVRGVPDPSNLIRCTINRSLDDYPVRPAAMYEDDIDMPLPIRPRNDMSNITVVARNEYMNFGRDSMDYSPSVPERMYMDDYDQPIFTRHLDPPRNQTQMSGNGARMSQEMRARLDTPAKPSPYNYPPQSHSPPPSLGHRIVVSNLHSSVTHEDIKELFEDIGPLYTSRLVRAGIAEVIYKLQKDAKKAVDAYHNRQLDGQPMKCLLVNQRPSSGPANSGVLKSSNMPTVPKFPSSSKSTVVPDLTVVHRALFTGK